MRFRKLMPYLIAGIFLALLLAAFFFIFNPLGLGPEPDTVLSERFFAAPAEDLSMLELLVDGQAAFTHLLSDISSATSSVYIQTFIWKDDEIGRSVVDRLKAAARRNVSVSVRKDLLGTFFELPSMMSGKPSPVFTRNGLKGYPNIDVTVSWREDTDHSKYVITDQRKLIFGGMNIADEYHLKWHDYMVAFQDDRWTRAFMDRVLKSFPWPLNAPFVIAVNDRTATEIRTALIEVIERSKDRLIIEHAYFSDDRIIEAVKRAAVRGVRVDIILPKRPDTHLYANWATINRLMALTEKASLRVFLYPKMMHAKVLLSDGVIAAVGSANLTPRSMLTSRELTMFVHGTPETEFIRVLRRQLDSDLSSSEPVRQPFQLSTWERLGAVVGKYVW